MNNEISLSMLWKIFKLSWKKIVIITVAVMLIAALFTHFFIAKTYSSSIKFYVINQTNQTYDQSATFTIKQNLAKEYGELILTDTVVMPLSEELKALNIEYTPNQLKRMISYTVVESIGMFTLKISNTNNEHAYIIAQLVADKTPQIIKNLKGNPINSTDGKEIEFIAVVDQPEFDTEHDSPSMIKNIFFSGVLSVAVVYIICLLISLFDTVIKTEEDIKDLLQKYPLIATIPTWTEK